MENSSEYESDSDSELDTSVKQEICRYKPQEKTPHKKFMEDKEFRVRKPWIDSKTCDQIWKSPYYCQEYKDEFSDGPYGSDIESSKDEWSTGRHDLNATEITIGELIIKSNKKLINDIPK